MLVFIKDDLSYHPSCLILALMYSQWMKGGVVIWYGLETLRRNV